MKDDEDIEKDFEDDISQSPFPEYEDYDFKGFNPKYKNGVNDDGARDKNGNLLKPHQWRPGQSGNRAGRPPKGYEKGTPRGRMRNTLTRLHKLEDACFDKIETILALSAERKLTDTEKTQLEIAKWTLKNIESMNGTCLKEETLIINMREKNRKAADQLKENQAIPEEQNTPARFSMDLDDMESFMEVKH